jgi:hypothetical protein
MPASGRGPQLSGTHHPEPGTGTPFLLLLFGLLDFFVAFIPAFSHIRNYTR